ncbi:MAG: helix-turn-helix domain-containing protein [Aestuariivita sp.]|nr:helix-turn-helix domain-containing protein [Aestuariivita sp.]
MTVRDVAGYLNVDEKTVYRLAKRGDLPGFTTDLGAWLQNVAPPDSVIHVLVMATHRLGEWQSEKRIKEVAKAAGKTIELHIWAAIRLENRMKYRNSSDVLWPASVPDDPEIMAYIEQEERFPLQTRTAGVGKSDMEFTSAEGRQLLEQEFLRAGVRIRGFCQNPSPIMRPLGFGSFGVGFGSTIVTYRNCPNNAPLALWWGDPNAQPIHDLAHVGRARRAIPSGFSRRATGQHAVPVRPLRDRQIRVRREAFPPTCGAAKPCSRSVSPTAETAPANATGCIATMSARPC